MLSNSWHWPKYWLINVSLHEPETHAPTQPRTPTQQNTIWEKLVKMVHMIIYMYCTYSKMNPNSNFKKYLNLPLVFTIIICGEKKSKNYNFWFLKEIIHGPFSFLFICFAKIELLCIFIKKKISKLHIKPIIIYVSNSLSQLYFKFQLICIYYVQLQKFLFSVIVVILNRK